MSTLNSSLYNEPISNFRIINCQCLKRIRGRRGKFYSGICNSQFTKRYVVQGDIGTMFLTACIDCIGIIKQKKRHWLITEI